MNAYKDVTAEFTIDELKNIAAGLDSLLQVMPGLRYGLCYMLDLLRDEYAITEDVYDVTDKYINTIFIEHIAKYEGKYIINTFIWPKHEKKGRYDFLRYHIVLINNIINQHKSK